MENFDIAIAFFTFNRIEPVKRVFEVIREAKPNRLYLISDGPRAHKEGEDKKVAAVRSYIESNIDWDCQVFKNYSSENLSCGKRLSSGISWVFESEERAIFLEDDILPDVSFFRYCEEMLEHHKNDDNIFLISGNNPIDNLYDIKEDYTYTKIPFIWGWATWKHSWEKFQFDITDWPEVKKSGIFKRKFPLNAYIFYSSSVSSSSVAGSSSRCSPGPNNPPGLVAFLINPFTVRYTMGSPLGKMRE